VILHRKRSDKITSLNLVSIILGVALGSLISTHLIRIIGKPLVDFSEEKTPTIPATLSLRKLLKIRVRK
jgi:hypothetical protein